MKAFTLIETLLSLTLVLLLTSAMVFNMDSLWNNRVRMDTKIEDYHTLARYAKCNAELKGMKSKIVLTNNKVGVILENFQGSVQEIPTLQSQLDDLNADVLFESEDTNIVTYLPDGSVEKGGVISMTMDETNSVQIEVNEWDQFSIIHTNKVECEDSRLAQW